MKVGDKYVIEIEEIIRGYGNAEDDHVHEPIARIKGFNTLVFDQYGLEKLEPYSWEKTYVHGYKDGKNAVINESEKITSKDIADAYNKGLNKAWEVARKLVDMSDKDIEECFNVVALNTKGFRGILHYSSAFEVIKKIKEYEEKQKQDTEIKIKVGDEVIDYLGYKGVITKSRKGDSEFVQWMRYDGHTYGSPEGSLVKTGRHFSQIAEVLEKLRGEE